MANILNAAGDVLWEVADYLKTEAAGLQRLQGSSNTSSAELRTRDPRSAAEADTAGGNTAVALDGSRDSLYGPEGMNATAPDISLRAEKGESGAEGAYHGGESSPEGKSGLPDMLHGVKERISEGGRQLKEKFDEGYREERDRMAGEEAQDGPLLPRGSGEREGGSEGPLQETLQAAKARIDEENEELKQRFREGFQSQKTGEEC